MEGQVTLVSCKLKEAGRLSGHNCCLDVLCENGPLSFCKLDRIFVEVSVFEVDVAEDHFSEQSTTNTFHPFVDLHSSMHMHPPNQYRKPAESYDGRDCEAF